MNSLDAIIDALTSSDLSLHEIKVDAELIPLAKKPLDKMLDFTASMKGV